MCIFTYFSIVIKEVTRACVLDEDVGKLNCAIKQATARNIFGMRNAKVECSVCSSDGCNGAAQYSPAALLMVLPIALVSIAIF